MDRRTRAFIAKIAEEVLKEFEIEIPIQDIDEVVKRLNGRIHSVDDALVDSSIVRLDNQEASFMIIVSSCQSHSRRTFATAQEIGHLFLHMGYLSDTKTWESFNFHDSLENHTEKEFQAHEFASNFLMPQKEYIEYVSKNTEKEYINVYNLAEYFGVSESMATIRGKLIGALKWV